MGHVSTDGDVIRYAKTKECQPEQVELKILKQNGINEEIRSQTIECLLLKKVKKSNWRIVRPAL